MLCLSPLIVTAQPLTLTNTSTTNDNNGGAINPFVYSTSRYLFTLTAQATDHRQLSEEGVTRLEYFVGSEVSKAMKRGAHATDTIPANYFHYHDDRTLANMNLKGADTSPDAPHALTWDDVATFGRVLAQYVKQWQRVKRTSLVVVNVYGAGKQEVVNGILEQSV